MINIHTNNVPNPIGPYSQAILIENFLFISGQIALTSDSNNIPKNISQQTEIILNNIKIILEKSEFEIKNIIKTTIFIKNIQYIEEVNMTYESFFKKNFVKIFPARSCVEVSNLPKNSEIEIESIAYKK